jgi:hypothetical protein
MVDFKLIETGHDDGLHIRRDKFLVHDELFPKNIQGPISADKTYEQDATVRGPGDGSNLGARPQYQGREVISSSTDHNYRNLYLYHVLPIPLARDQVSRDGEPRTVRKFHEVIES